MRDKVTIVFLIETRVCNKKISEADMRSHLQNSF